jgi:hypothetical protein
MAKVEANYLGLMGKHFAEVDELGSVILKGHLILETILNNIFDTIFFHPEHVHAARLRFYVKVQVVKAYALRKDKIDVWELILAFNSLRNEIAHKLEPDERHKKVEKLREYLVREVSGEALGDDTDLSVVTLACSLCCGFLEALEKDLRSLRHMIDMLSAAFQQGRDEAVATK